MHLVTGTPLMYNWSLVGGCIPGPYHHDGMIAIAIPLVAMVEAIFIKSKVQFLICTRVAHCTNLNLVRNPSTFRLTSTQEEEDCTNLSQCQWSKKSTTCLENFPFLEKECLVQPRIGKVIYSIQQQATCTLVIE